MTFEQWQATRRFVLEMTSDEADLNEGAAGWVYSAGYVLRTRKGFRVPLWHDEHDFDTLKEAERFLWKEWVMPETAHDGRVLH